MFQVRICLVSTFCSDYARFINEMQAMMTQFRLIDFKRLIVAAPTAGNLNLNYY